MNSALRRMGYTKDEVTSHGFRVTEAALGFIPTNHGGHLVYLNPADLNRPIGFNLLGDVPEDLRPLVSHTWQGRP